jgi:hypothetical protein
MILVFNFRGFLECVSGVHKFRATKFWTVALIFLDSDCRTCLMSPFWWQDFCVGSYIFFFKNLCILVLCNKKSKLVCLKRYLNTD